VVVRVVQVGGGDGAVLVVLDGGGLVGGEPLVGGDPLGRGRVVLVAAGQLARGFGAVDPGPGGAGQMAAAGVVDELELRGLLVERRREGAGLRGLLP